MIVKILVPVVVTSLPVLTNIPKFDLNYKFKLFKSEGQLVPLNSVVESTVEKVFRHLYGIKFRTENQWKREKSYFQFNYTKSDYLITSGSMWLHECQLGLPYNVSFTRLDQAIDLLEIKGLYLDWESPENLEIASTYLLSELAKEFTIAQGVCQLWDKKFLPFNILVNGILSTIFVACYRPSQPTTIQLALFAVLISGVLIISSMVDSIMNMESIEEALTLNDQYLDGAIEFYQKIVSRNELINSRLAKQSNPFIKISRSLENDHARQTLNYLMEEKTKRADKMNI